MDQKRTTEDVETDRYLVSFWKRDFNLNINKEIVEAFRAGWKAGRDNLLASLEVQSVSVDTYEKATKEAQHG